MCFVLLFQSPIFYTYKKRELKKKLYRENWFIFSEIVKSDSKKIQREKAKMCLY